MIYFLSSIPRSGSTLLASLLGQREDTYVSPTSTFGSLVKSFLTHPVIPEPILEVMAKQFNAKYAGRKEPYIFDKGRMWPESKMMEMVNRFQGDVKIVCTVRPMVECISSFYRVEKTDLPIEDWMVTSKTFEGLMQAYHDFKNGYELHPERFCLIQYDDLCENTQRELNRISDFIGSPAVNYNPKIGQVEDDNRDNMWGIEGLHTLRPTIERDTTDPRTALGLDLYNKYTSWDFWTDTQKYQPWTYGESTKQFIEA
jgi:hypothetical protein